MELATLGPVLVGGGTARLLSLEGLLPESAVGADLGIDRDLPEAVPAELHVGVFGNDLLPFLGEEAP